ncbi:MAG: ABC transporter ATP-binding protein [Catonella sp.]|uniref:ABC transporter ATP-binding protein n=1 Tax=Catonella sp. TaxID=2382125 RepID=UPI003FA108C8
MNKTVLTIKNLTKLYKNNTKANDNISLNFESGEITALIGHNGAGKTTLLNQVIGLVKPTNGEILINGINIVNKPSLARKLVSSMPQFQVPIKGVSVYQAVDSILRVKGFSKGVSKEKATNIIKELQIDEWGNVSGEKLSGGLQRLTSFAMTVTSDTPVVLLDEPTNDVDPVRRIVMWRYLRKLADNGVIVIIVTHNLLEVEKYADRYVLLDKGCVKKDTKTCGKSLKGGEHIINIIGIEKDSISVFRNVYNTKYYDEEKRLLVFLKESEVINAVETTLKLLREEQIISYDLKIGSLNDTYGGMIDDDD